MNAIRKPAVAGMFYQSDPAELARSIDAMLAKANADGPAPKALIAPHAGHIYSGPIAASVYARLKPVRDKIKRVVLLGPSHRVGFRGIAASSAETYRTPLGDIPVDQETVRRVTSLPATGYLDQAHAQEHSLEVHLPFLQRVLDDFVLVPLVVGDASKEDVAKVLDALWGGEETLIVISSDLSHYHPYDEARHLDAETSSKIVSLKADLHGEEACGCRPINGLLHLAAKRGMTVRQVDLRNSGDTAGDRSRVVGYGAYVVEASPAAQSDTDDEDTTAQRGKPGESLPLAWRQRLLQVGREAILQPLVTGGSYNLDLNHFPEALRQERASFVTLHLNGQLRGCIGSLTAHRALVADVANNAQAAAFKDPRFSPVSFDEYHDIDVHISVLSRPEPMAVDTREELLAQLRPGVDGLIIEERGHRATYLPSVWEQLPDPESFVDELRRKAGLDRGGWHHETRVFRYTTEEFS